MSEKIKWSKSISTRLLKWFLLLSLLPVIIISLLSYKNSSDNLYRAASSELEHSSISYVNFIDNWFFYRKTDINAWSKTNNTINFMRAVSEGLASSQESPQEYIKSSSYTSQIEPYKHDLIELSRQYEHLYDVFLIDLKGNILYSLAQEDDLGTNLKHGKYSSTLFSKAFNQTLADGKVHFSDFEHYSPSDKHIFGFLCSAILSQEGERLGVFAVQISQDRIASQFENINREDNGIFHYLLGGEDLKLRSSINNKEEVLNRRIKTEQTDLYQAEHIDPDSNIHEEKVFNYLGSNARQVIGMHHPVDILGVKWVLISEMDENKALESSHELALQIFLIMLFAIIIITSSALFFSRYFTQPILAIYHSFQDIADGKERMPVWVDQEDEIAQLADAFNNMIEQLNVNEQTLKRNSEEIRKAQHDLNILDQHTIIEISDINGNITYANEKFIDISGYSIDEILGENHRILESKVHDKEFWEDMYKTIMSGKAWHNEICNKAKDGHLYWLDTTIAPFLNDKGIPESFISIRNDITQKKAAEKKILETLSLNKAILESTDNGILVTDGKNKVILTNNRFAELWRIPESLLQSKDEKLMLDFVLDQLSDPLMFIKGVEDLYNNKLRVAHDILLCKDERVYERLSHPMEINGKPEGRVWNFRDITEKEKSNKALLEAKEEAEQGARAKAEFLASMSHEIRTPMNGVIGMLGLLTNSELDQTQKHQVSLAQSSAHSLLTLINDILDFSKVDAGKMELENLEFNLRDELGNFTETIAFRAQKKGVELILDLKNIEHLQIVSDPGRLRQIMSNLVGNSIKFTHDGEIVITCELKVEGKEKGRLFVTVQDSGIGIPEDKLPKLFESFTQVDSSTTRKYGGTGLGLAISKKLTELMGGSISVKSELGKGSSFSFNIEVGLKEHPILVIPHVSVKGKRVLIIDDNAINREILHSQLEHWGMEIYEAQDGLKALEICQEHLQKKNRPPFDIAFVDMNMPDMDGCELVKKLRSIPEYDKMKLVMMTSLSSRSEAKTFAEIGFDAYFPKPTTTKDLFNALNVLIEDADTLHEAGDFITKDNLHAMIEPETITPWPEETRILLVEDNLTNQIVANGIMETFGLCADIANNGEEAIAMLKEARSSKAYTLVLMDCLMPVLDGYSATEYIRQGEAGEENIKIPIIAMTANAMKGDREHCISVGMDDYLSKPISPDTIKDMLIKWLKYPQKII